MPPARAQKLIKKRLDPWGRLIHSDPITQYLEDARDTFRISSFESFDLTINISPAAGANAIVGLKGQLLGYDQYKFDFFRGGEKYFQVRLSKSGLKPRIFYLGRWHHVSRFFKELPPSDSAEDDEGEGFHQVSCKSSQWEAQWRWWVANGKRFRLLELPGEIREVIYSFVLGHKIVLPSRVTKNTVSAARLRGEILAHNPKQALLRLNKQVNYEANYILSRDALFNIHKTSILHETLANTLLCSRITRLELALSHHQFLKLFRFKRISEYCEGAPRSAKALRNLKLNELIINLQAPSRVNTTAWQDVACQKTVVDWVFEAALPWVMYHPTSVTGFAKNVQKAEFEAKCAAMRKGFLAWCEQMPFPGEEYTLQDYHEWMSEEDGGVRLDGVMVSSRTGIDIEWDEETVQDEMVEFPPVCRCVPSCESKTWNAE